MHEAELKELGLTDNEVTIYITLLQHGVLNPYQLAEKTGLHRGYLYDCLERMQEKGIVSSVQISNKKHFQATPPGNLVELMQYKLETIKKIVPDLAALQTIAKEDTTIELHKGRRAYRTLLKDIPARARRNEQILLYGVDEKHLLEEVEPIYLKQYFTIINEKNIKEKIIIQKGKQKVDHPHVQYKELEKKYIGNTSHIIYADTIGIFIQGNPYYLILIRNKEVADTYKKQFEILWKTASKTI